MMTKKKTPKIKKLKFVWALPALTFLLFAFAQPEYELKKVETENSGITKKSEKEYVIHGKVVKEENGEPLPGAAVLIKGTAIGTVAGKDGSFIITDPNPEIDEKTGSLSSELVISYVGFETMQCKVGASGEAIKNGKFTAKLKEGVIVIDADNFIKGELPPPPPPPKTETVSLPPPPPSESTEKQGEEFYIIENLPQYPGGFYALGQYVTGMEEKLAQQKNIKGKAKIGFTIDANGKVTDIKIMEKDNDLAGNGGASIVMNMKDWQPGMQRGKKVPVHYILPVEF